MSARTHANPDCGCEEELDRLILQAQRLEDRVHDYVSKSDQLLRLTLLVGTLAVSLAQIGDPSDSPEAVNIALGLAPLLYTMLLISTAQKDRETAALAEWQRRLEIEIHNRTGLKLHIWESVVSQRGRFSTAAAALGTFYVLLLIGLWIAGGAAVFNLASPGGDTGWAIGAYGSLAVISMAGAAASFLTRGGLKRHVEVIFGHEPVLTLPDPHRRGCPHRRSDDPR